MSNFLFLDVDGVLNKLNLCEGRFIGHSSKGSLLFVDDVMIGYLKEVYDKHDLKIILSSTWRTDEKSFEAITKVLQAQEMTIVGCTPIFKEKMPTFAQNRTNEILSWVGDNISEKDTWIAVDDCALKLDITKFVRTKDKIGFTQERKNYLDHMIINK